MLEITIDELEYWDDTDEDETKHHFATVPGVTIQLEHSLVSISKWEQKWKIPYLQEGKTKTEEQLLDYIKCMTLNKVDDTYYRLLSPEQIYEIKAYIDDSMTATWFSDREKKTGKKDIITNEVIYAWLVLLNIPFEVQYWHFSRLITLIQVVNEKNSPPKKTSRSDLLKKQYELNEARLAKYNTTG